MIRAKLNYFSLFTGQRMNYVDKYLEVIFFGNPISVFNNRFSFTFAKKAS